MSSQEPPGRRSGRALIAGVSEAWYPLPAAGPVSVDCYIDGLFEDEIRGWVVDVERPGRILSVCLRINGAYAGKVAACLFRPDLAPVFESNGLHGFAFRVPGEYFEEAHWDVEILLEDGRYLNPKPLRIEVPRDVELTPVRSPCVLFIHTPKSAGTALRNTLQRSKYLARHLLLYPETPGFRGEYVLHLSESQMRDLEWIYGHFAFRMHQFLVQPCVYATMLREPVERTLSHYLQLVRNVPHSEAAKAGSPEAFFSRAPDGDFDNLMTRLISGETADVLAPGCVDEHVFARAVDNLNRRFVYVGLREQADESQRQVSALLGLPQKKLTIENPGGRNSSEAFSADTLALVRQMNKFDLRLYAYVRDTFWSGGRSGWVREAT